MFLLPQPLLFRDSSLHLPLCYVLRTVQLTELCSTRPHVVSTHVTLISASLLPLYPSTVAIRPHRCIFYTSYQQHSRDSSAGISTELRDFQSGFWFPADVRYSFWPKPVWGPSGLLFSGYRRPLLGIKRPEREGNYSTSIQWSLSVSVKLCTHSHSRPSWHAQGDIYF